MKNFLGSTKGKIIAGAVTLCVVAAVVIAVIMSNTGYRSIKVDGLNGTTTVTSGASTTDAFIGQNLKSGDNVAVQKSSDLTLALDSDKHVYAAELTRFRLEAFGTSGKDSRTVINLEEGSVLSSIDAKLSAGESYVVETPSATMSVRGTVFNVSTKDMDTTVSVDEGEVEAFNKLTGETQIISAGQTRKIGMSSLAPVYRDPEALAVEAAIEAYLNGGELDTTNFDRVTKLSFYGNTTSVTLDEFTNGTFINGWGYKANAAEMEILADGVSIPMVYHVTIDRTSTSETFEDIDMGSAKCVDVIKYMPAINELKIWYNELSDLSALSALESPERMHTVWIENCKQLTDISALSAMTQLNNLSLDNNDISDISALSSLTQLESLQLRGNNLSDISPLSSLTQLKMLYLDNNNISDVSALSAMTQLDSLYLYNNKISDISPLYGLTSLKSIGLYSNNITDEEAADLKSALGIKD